jgi:translation initiation factor IF-2
MNDITDKNKKTLSTLTINSSKLSLGKPAEGGLVRQNFAHGRSKTVTVEVKKTRAISRDTASHSANVGQTEPSALQEVTEINELDNLSSLTTSERNARVRALQLAAEEAERVKKENLIKEQQKKEAELLAQAQAQEQEKEQASEQVEILIETETPILPVANQEKEKTLDKAASTVSPTKATSVPLPTSKASKNAVAEIADEDMDDDDDGKKKGPTYFHKSFGTDKAGKKTAKLDSKAAVTKSKWEEKRIHNKLSVNNLLEDEEERSRSLASIKRAREKAKRHGGGSQTEQEKIVREVILPEVITVQELANRMAQRSVDVIKELMKLGIITTVNQSIDADTAELVIETFGHKVKRVTESDVENILITTEDKEEDLEVRAPVVTVMGHVDHGKTSLLDALRSTDIAAKEAGGITQHIGAYRIQLESGDHITFLDTPGHEAFTAMRLRGAKVTDLVILVVAADDGIKAQTIEAINHAKAANVPILVAINKIDKPEANPERVKNELLNQGLVAEEFGGDTVIVEVSAKQRLNLDKLEEAILLQAEMLDLKANPNRAAAGSVVEATLNPGRGVTATLLVQHGTLKVGDIIVAGNSYGRVRAMTDDKGKALTEATPSMPVEIIGLSDAPEAGDSFDVVSSEKQARDISEFREKRMRSLRIAKPQKITLEELFSSSSGSAKNKELTLVIKGDVQGSVEAIIASINKLTNEEVRARILHSAVGGITESDVSLAKASNALILGFNVRANAQARQFAEREGVDIRYFSIIYDLLNDVKMMLSGMLSPILREEYLGSAEIRQVFNITKVGKIAGSFVLNGMIKRGAKVRLLRDNIVIHEGKLKTLKRFKEDIKEVKEGFECGIAFENYDDIRENDIVEAFEIIEEKQNLAIFSI